MNWNLKTATGREKLLILDRKHSALCELEPDLMPDKPFSFFPYMSQDCVLRSEKLPEPLTGQAIRDFLIREKRAAVGFGPTPFPCTVESEEDADILLRIRPRFGDEEPDGELVRLELNAEGKVCLIDRFDEKKVPYRKAGSFVSLTPVRIIREGDSIRYEQDKAQRISFSGLYYDEMTLLFDLVPDGPQFTDMEDRSMEISEWDGILKMWKKINEAGDFDALHDMVFRAEEKYLRNNKWYEQELDRLVRDVADKREPYGRRMQAWMEDWLNCIRDKYDRIRKC